MPQEEKAENQRQKHYAPSHASEIIEYLENTYKIAVPDNFFQELEEALCRSSSSSFSFSLAKVDVIVRACRMWKDYVEDINSLICHEVLSMARIHVSVIWARSLTRDGFALKRKIPASKETIINSFGYLTAIP